MNNPGLASQDFQSGNAAPGGIAGCFVPVDTNSNDNCFTPGQILPGIQFIDNPVHPPPGEFGMNIIGSNFGVTGNPFTALINNFFAASFDIVFLDNNVSAVGMDMGCVDAIGGDTPCSNSLVVQVFGVGDVFMRSTTVAVTGAFDTFLGLSSAQTISRINLELESPTPEIAKGIDRISFGEATAVVSQVPTLSEWGLIAMAGILGIIGFIVIRRRNVTA
jgi:hypothetical protein